MVRTKVEIKRIEDKAKRHTTFTKRRQGLFKKVNELCKRCDAEAAVITFSLAGNAFVYGYPSVESVLNRYNAHSEQQQCLPVDTVCADGQTQHVKDKASVDDSPPPAAAVSNDDVDIESYFNVDAMGLEELDEIRVAMEDMKRKVVHRLNEISGTLTL
ncbi:unnamed protein product [Cuscuta campestris]|uniref:MADS-box domain-containing protein n=1 Tax=Cuscuta campestris TaxID=132261 RepID=A0A484MVQ1_9ASTE|nr:unnamed protein product [Cuscuta campestris]